MLTSGPICSFTHATQKHIHTHTTQRAYHQSTFKIICICWEMAWKREYIQRKIDIHSSTNYFTDCSRKRVCLHVYITLQMLKCTQKIPASSAGALQTLPGKLCPPLMLSFPANHSYSFPEKKLLSVWLFILCI